MNIDQTIEKLQLLKKEYPELADKKVRIILSMKDNDKVIFCDLESVSFCGGADGISPSIEGEFEPEDLS